MKHRASVSISRRGAALLLSLWAVIVLSAAIMIWAGYVRHTLKVAGNQQNDSEARAWAHSGVALALHPLVSKETPVLQQWSEGDPGFRVRMISEGSKLNINVLLRGEDPMKMDLLRRWLEYRGIEFNDRERMLDCMLDWLDADNLKRINGMEDAQGYHPPNRSEFLDVEEIKEVAGTEALVSQPGWKDDLTVDSAGQIDITSAEFHILRLLPGLGDIGIQRFLDYRKGDDGIDGTIDDPVIQRMEDARPFFGLNQTQWSALGGLIGPKDSNWRIIAEGWSGKVRRQIEVVAQKGGQNPTIKRWNE